MTKLSFLVTIGVIVLASLGAVALRYNLQISPGVQPFVVVYHDNAPTPGQSAPSGERYWTLAVRSDGSSMKANTAPDASGHIGMARAVQLRDRYVVVNPHTRSISTYKPYIPIVGPAQDCSGSRTSPVLGHPVEFTREETRNAKSHLVVTRERWLALDLDCVALRERVTMTDDAGTPLQFNREAVSVKLGEPPADYFDVPSNYQERGPEELNTEFESSFPGQHVFCKGAVDKLQKVYDSDKLK
jgi:hypothetical protein